MATPQLKAGYIEDTLLDPHAANNSVPAQGSEGSGILKSLANDLIRAYQAKANDPPVFIPPGVDSAQVFYQHTSARHDHGTNLGIYNLWGQVPVPNLSGAPVSYFNLTAAGAVHSGKYGVALWYRNFVAPSLGNQAPWIQSLQLEGQINQAVVQPDIGAGALASRRTQAWGPVRTAPGPRIVFAGTAAPESKVRVYIGPAAKSSVITLAGQTTASSNGTWTLTSRPLLDGYDRAIAMAYRRVRGARPGLAVVPVAPLGRFKVTTDLPTLEHLDHGGESKPSQW